MQPDSKGEEASAGGGKEGGGCSGNVVSGRMPEQSNDYRVVVFGAGGVGKSSLVLRFVKGTFRESYIPTIEDTYRQAAPLGLEAFAAASLRYRRCVDYLLSGSYPSIYLAWVAQPGAINIAPASTALGVIGMHKPFHHNKVVVLGEGLGHAFILVYSVTSRQSLEELRPIWDAIKETKGAELTGIPVMLVGNKCDEGEEGGGGSAREVRPEEGEAEAQRWGCNFMETSAKTNHNVKELFQELLNMEKNRNISLQLDSKKKGKGGSGSGKGAGKMKEKCSVM